MIRLELDDSEAEELAGILEWIYTAPAPMPPKLVASSSRIRAKLDRARRRPPVADPARPLPGQVRLDELIAEEELLG